MMKIQLLCLLSSLCLLTASCSSLPPQPDEIINKAYKSYQKKSADGEDINAMLSYFTVMVYTNTPRTWKGYRELTKSYLNIASSSNISSNYPRLAGEAETMIVSNFLFDVIGYLDRHEIKTSYGPDQIGGMSGGLISMIHSAEFKKPLDEQILDTEPPPAPTDPSFDSLNLIVPK